MVGRGHSATEATPNGKEAGSSSRSLEYRSLADLPRETAVELVECYLDKVHDRPHSIFHPPTLRKQLRNGAVGQTLLCAICAVGSKFSPDPDRRTMEACLAAEAKRRLKADLENICIENIQACILVALTSAGNCQIPSEALFIRMGFPGHPEVCDFRC